MCSKDVNLKNEILHQLNFTKYDSLMKQIDQDKTIWNVSCMLLVLEDFVCLYVTSCKDF